MPAVFVLCSSVHFPQSMQLSAWLACLGALAVSYIEPQDFAPHCPGSVGDLQLLCLLLFCSGPWGLFTGTLFAGRARTGSVRLHRKLRFGDRLDVGVSPGPVS